MMHIKDRFLIIAITSPGCIENEGKRICEILDNQEADIVHIRKPDWSLNQVYDLLTQIPAEYYDRIKLHDHFSLLERFPLLGVHLNSRNGIAPKCVKSVSRSFHEISQLDRTKEYDYVTLSPIFDSISKTNYHSSFKLKELMPMIKGKNVIALGGVTPEKFPELKNAGFYGAAMLGFFWI